MFGENVDSEVHHVNFVSITDAASGYATPSSVVLRLGDARLS